MARKSKRSFLRTAIITLVGLLVVAGLFMWGRSSGQNNRTSVNPENPSPTSSAMPTHKISSLPQPAGGAASTVDQATPAPGAPHESTTYGTSGTSSAIGTGDSDTTSCSGAAGISCTVYFTNQADGETVAILPAQNIPSAGTTSWSWTPYSLKIGPGSYMIQAFLLVNGKKIGSNVEILYVHS